MQNFMVNTVIFTRARSAMQHKYLVERRRSRQNLYASRLPMHRALFDFKKVLLPPSGNVTINSVQDFCEGPGSRRQVRRCAGRLRTVSIEISFLLFFFFGLAMGPMCAPGEYLLVFTSGNDDDKATIIMPLTVTGAAPAVIEEFPAEDSVEDDQLVQL